MRHDEEAKMYVCPFGDLAKLRHSIGKMHTFKTRANSVRATMRAGGGKWHKKKGAKF